MAPSTAISDDTVAQVLGGFAGLANRALANPERWLGVDQDLLATAPVPRKILDAVRDRTFGRTTPASTNWSGLPLKQRTNWWLRRIAVSAGLAAAAPRFAGPLADRIPLPNALGACAAGLAVCATARERGVTDPAAWVPLLGKVLFDRDLPTGPAIVPDEAEAEADLAAAGEAGAETEATEDAGDTAAPAPARGFGAGARRAAGTLWHLTRGLYELSSMLDDRPHGLLIFRAIGKLPVVGVAGGWLDERGAIRRASRRTAELV